MTRRIAIYLFPDVEVLDFAGPYEVFTTASRMFGRRRPSAEPPFEATARQMDVDCARMPEPVQAADLITSVSEGRPCHSSLPA